MVRIFKILSAEQWLLAQKSGRFEGSEVDLRDGYIHFSTAEQAQETALRYFSGQNGLVIVGFDAASLGDGLKWEPSRHGQLFPHLYGVLDPGQAIFEAALPWDGVRHVFPEGLLP